jgi:hypothetical protein
VDAMNCLQFEENVHGLVRLEILDLAVRDRALDHAAACPSCAALLADVQTWVEISEEDADDARREETPKPVELALLAAFRQQHRQRRAWRQSLQWASMGAVAAGLLLAAAITYPKWSAEILRRPVAVSTSAVQKSGQSSVTLPAENSEGGQLADADSMANFVPVPYSDPLDSDDPGLVVHVALTRGSLGELGYPVDKAHAAEVVQADVLVGEDGWPRAVRLLQ